MIGKRTIGFVCLAFLSGSLGAQCKFEFDIAGTDVRCFGEANGTAQISIRPVRGGNGPYVIDWFDDFDADYRDDLPAGTHFVEITDEFGCAVNEFITIDQPGLLTGTLVVENVQCHGQPQGSIALNMIGGTPPLNYQWSNSDDEPQITNLIAGDYAVLVTDNRGCEFDTMTTITQPNAIQVSSSVMPVSCYGDEDGEIKAIVFGGTSPFKYQWSRGDTIPDIFELDAGTHLLTVTDGNGCIHLEEINVPEPLPIEIDFVPKKVSCFDLPDGEIFASVSGGNPDYQYQWSNSAFVLGDVTNFPKNLYSDTYTLLVTDRKGCQAEESVLLIEPNPLVIDLEKTDASCFKKPDGQIDLSVSGGTPPYAVLWSTGSRNEDIVNLYSDTYAVDVVDELGCTRYGEIFVGQPDSLKFRAVVEQVSCKDQTDGIITLYPDGGTPNYFARWDDGHTGFRIEDLSGGLHTVVLTDAQDCQYIGEFRMPVDPKDCISLLNIPNTFTPNGDDYNDIWRIDNYEVYPEMEIHVVDKWGDTVFESIGYTQPWGGDKNGTDVKSGTYYYTVNLRNGDKPFTGTLTIVK